MRVVLFSIKIKEAALWKRLSSKGKFLPALQDGLLWMVISATPVTLLLAFQRSASGKILLCTLRAQGTHASVQTGLSDSLRGCYGRQHEGNLFSFMSEYKHGSWGRCPNLNPWLPYRQRNGEHCLPEGSVGEASNSPFCSWAPSQRQCG